RGRDINAHILWAVPWRVGRGADWGDVGGPDHLRHLSATTGVACRGPLTTVCVTPGQRALLSRLGGRRHPPRPHAGGVLPWRRFRVSSWLGHADLGAFARFDDVATPGRYPGRAVALLVPRQSTNRILQLRKAEDHCRRGWSCRNACGRTGPARRDMELSKHD